MAKKPKLLEGRRAARAVAGKVLYPNFARPLATAGGAVLVLFLLMCLATLVMTVTPSGTRVQGVFLARIVAWALIAGIALVVALGTFIYLLLRFRRVVVGGDRVQLIGDVGRVIGQVPYDNILLMKMGMVLRPDASDVCIQLHTLRRRDTWWPRHAEGMDAADIVVNGGVEIDGTRLRMELDKALRAYRERHGPPRWMER